MKIVNRDSDKEEFEDNKLYNSVVYPAKECSYSDEDAEALADKALWLVKEWLSSHEDGFATTREIRRKVIEVLEDEDEDVAFMYESHLDVN